MQAGELRTPISLEEPSETVTSGNAVPVYTNRGMVWSKWEGLGGRAEGINTRVDARVTIRFRSDITMRWRIGLVGTARKFHMTAPPSDPDGRGRELTMILEEILD